MFCRWDGAERVVVDLDQVSPPPKDEREVILQQHPDHGSKRRRPGRNAAERRRSPVYGVEQQPDFAASGKEASARLNFNGAQFLANHVRCRGWQVQDDRSAFTTAIAVNAPSDLRVMTIAIR